MVCAKPRLGVIVVVVVVGVHRVDLEARRCARENCGRIIVCVCVCVCVLGEVLEGSIDDGMEVWEFEIWKRELVKFDDVFDGTVLFDSNGHIDYFYTCITMIACC